MGAVPAGDDHSSCRLREFARWDRTFLEHERAYLSKVMTGSAFMKPEEVTGIMHDLSDIDECLSYCEK